MFSCTECSWEITDEDVSALFPNIEKDKEITCPICGAETNWYDGTEEGTIW